MDRYRLHRKRKRAAANRKHFTVQNVLVFKPKKKQYLIWDQGTDAARGLAILISPTGTKSYRCVYYYPGSSRPNYMHLGRVGELGLAEARQRCRDVRAKARRGEDPKADTPAQSDSFKTAVEGYIRLEQIGRHANKSAGETEAVIIKNCSDWHTRPVATIRDLEIEKLLCRIRDGDSSQGLKPRPYLANRLYSHLKDFFGWCARRHTMKSSPMGDMQKPWEGAKSRERDWFKKSAGDSAIVSLWRAADELGKDDGRYLKLLLLTGKRKSALANMRWEEIDDAWFWDPPPSDVQNKRLHGVPLPGLAQRVLHPRQSQGRVFGQINLSRLQNNVRRLTGIADFFYHGVRHLVETKTAELRDAQDQPLILPHVRDLLFDHASKRGSGKGYDHHDYKLEMRAAMEAWAHYIERIVQPEGLAVLR